MTTMRRNLGLSGVAILAVLSACDDGLIRPPAPEPATLAVAAVLEHGSASDAQAWAKLDQVMVRVLDGTGAPVEQTTAPFDPAAAETVVSVSVPLEDLTQEFLIELSLRSGSQVLFTGDAEATLTTGGTTEVQIVPQPLIAGIACTGLPLSLRSYGAAQRLTAFPLFASGDTVSTQSLPVTWSTSDASTVTVSTAGDVTGLKDGSATVTCSSGPLTSTRSVQVFAIVKSVRIEPQHATTEVGANFAFTASHLDSLGNVITGPRTTTWMSTNEGVATVSNTGRATGVSPGTVTIRAASGDGTGAATLTVVFPPPLVTTGPATGVTATGATVSGQVNPRGTATQAWFEFGTSETLANASSTPPQQVGSGNASQAVNATLANLLPNVTYYYRVAASSEGGTARGSILSFTTASPPLVRTVSATVEGTSVLLRGAANPLGLPGLAWFEWSTSPTLANAQRTSQQGLGAGRTEVAYSASLTGLEPGTTYYFRAAASNAAGTSTGLIQGFVVGTPPLATTQAPTGVEDNAATLWGLVNPNGAATEAWFEWGIGTAPTVFQSTARQAVGAGTAAVSVAQLLSGLQPLTTYSFRVVAENAVGLTRGLLTSFTTSDAPDVSGTGTVWDYSEQDTSWVVDFFGVVNPNGAATQAWFQWSADITFANVVNTARVNVGSAFTARTYTIRGLVPDCGPWYYRAVASNVNGTTFGATRTTYCEGGG